MGDAQAASSVGSTFASGTWPEAVSVWSCRVTEKPTPLINACCTFSLHVLFCKHYLNAVDLSGSMRIMALLRRSPSRTRTFPKAVRRVPSCHRMCLTVNVYTALLDHRPRLGASPRLCFEKYVDVSPLVTVACVRRTNNVDSGCHRPAHSGPEPRHQGTIG